MDPPEVICSKLTNYEIFEMLGCGTYGTVFKARKRTSSKIVALKVMQNELSYRNEIDKLFHLREENADDFNFIRAFRFSQTGDYKYIEFEMLEQSFFNFLKQKNCAPLPLLYIRPILQQISKALLKFSELGIIHGDLKLNNIMLVDSIREPYKIKIIDFGNALHAKHVALRKVIQPVCFRAPEVILGLPYSEAIDMWSLGCIAAQLFLGRILYPGLREFDQIRYIIETQGLPPKSMLDSGEYTSKFFNYEKDSWRLKTIQEYEAETNIKAKKFRTYIFSSLDRIGDLYWLNDWQGGRCKYFAEICDRNQFINLFKRMLSIEPATRLTAAEALKHPFITLTHFEYYQNCNSVKECVQMMEVCHRGNENRTINQQECYNFFRCTCGDSGFGATVTS